MTTKTNRSYTTLLVAATVLLFACIYSCNGSGSGDMKKDSAAVPADSVKMSTDSTKMMDTTKKATDTGTKGGQQSPTGH